MENNTSHVFLMGCRGSGKTSFLSGLASLTRGGSDGKFQLVANDGTTVRIITDLRTLVEQQNWPPPTSSMIPLDFELTYRSPFGERKFHIAILDYPGEDLLEAMESLKFEERKPLAEQFERANYVLVVADPTQDLVTSLNTFEKETRRRQDALVQAVGQLVKTERGGKQSDRIRRPEIAVLVTKGDLVDANGVVRLDSIASDNRGFLNNLCRYSASRPKCFLLSSYGKVSTDADGRTFPPEVPKPEGYEPLFDWLSKRHFWASNKFKVTAGLAIVVVILSMILAFYFYSKNRGAKRAAAIENATIERVSEISKNPGGLGTESRNALDKRISDEIARIDQELSGGPTAERLNEMRRDLISLLEIPDNPTRSRLVGLRSQVENTLDESLFNAIQAARRVDAKSALELIAEYKRGYPKGNHVDEVTRVFEEIVGQQQADSRARIRAVLVNSRESAASKAKEIRNYLVDFQDDPNADEMAMAAEVAEIVATSNELRLRLKSCGFEVYRRKHGIKLVTNISEPNLEFWARTDSHRLASTFEDTTRVVASKDWREFKIELWDLWGFDSVMASVEIDLLRDLARFDGKLHLQLTDAPGYPGLNSYMVFEVQVRSNNNWRALSPEELQAYAKFLVPGGEW